MEEKTNIKAHPLYASLSTQIISLHLVKSSLEGKSFRGGGAWKIHSVLQNQSTILGSASNFDSRGGLWPVETCPDS